MWYGHGRTCPIGCYGPAEDLPHQVSSGVSGKYTDFKEALRCVDTSQGPGDPPFPFFWIRPCITGPWTVKSTLHLFSRCGRPWPCRMIEKAQKSLGLAAITKIDICHNLRNMIVPARCMGGGWLKRLTLTWRGLSR